MVRIQRILTQIPDSRDSLLYFPFQLSFNKTRRDGVNDRIGGKYVCSFLFGLPGQLFFSILRFFNLFLLVKKHNKTIDYDRHTEDVKRKKQPRKNAVGFPTRYP